MAPSEIKHIFKNPPTQAGRQARAAVTNRTGRKSPTDRTSLPLPSLKLERAEEKRQAQTAATVSGGGHVLG